MKKEQFIKNEHGVFPCKHCFQKGEIVYPQVRNDDEVWYTVCPKCCHYDTYEFIGVNKKRTIENWNDAMKG